MLDDDDNVNELGRILGRSVARAGKSVAKGAASLGDLVNSPVNAARSLFNLPPLQSPSELTGQLADYLSGGATIPRNKLENVVDTAGEFIGGGGALSGLSKGTQAAKGLGINSLQELLGLGSAGAGTEIAHQNFPESSIAPLVGGLAGGFVPGAVKGAGQALGYGLQQLGNLHPGLNAQRQLQGATQERIQPTIEAAQRLGEHVTPAEAAHSPLLAARQGKLGTSEVGAERLQKLGEKNAANRQENIGGLLEDIAPVSEGQIGVDERVRNVAGEIIKSREKALIDKARPYYTKAESMTIPETALDNLYQKHPIIGEAVDKVLGNSIYQAELQGFTPNSTKVLDLAKRQLDDQIGMAMRTGEGNKARLLTNAKNDLIQTIDKLNPDYQKARAIYAEDSPGIQKLKDSPLGKIAGRKDQTIKNIGKDIFDNQQTNPKVFNELRDEIYQADPEAWNSIVRQEMERRLGSVEEGASNFYRKVLKSGKSYRMFHEALKGNPEAQQTLKDMRLVYKDLVDPVSVKTAAGQAKSSLSVPRSTGQFVANAIDNLIGGKYDNAAIDLITDPKWAEQAKQARAAGSPAAKKQMYGRLLETVAKDRTEREEADPIRQLSDAQLDEMISEQELQSLSDEELDRLIAEQSQ